MKLDNAASFPEAVRAVAHAGIPVWAQFGVTPHAAFRYGGTMKDAPAIATAMKDQSVVEAKLLQDAGASLLDFTHSGPIAGPEVVRAVGIPVIGGLGGGPWLDGRVRSVFAAIGYMAAAVDDDSARYANVARIAFTAIKAYGDDVRGGRDIPGAAPKPAGS